MRRRHAGLSWILLVVMTLLHGERMAMAGSALEERTHAEEQIKALGHFILPYRPNYILPLSYNPRPNYDTVPAGTSLKDVETKFQFSLKIPVADRLFNYNVTTYFAYTQLSFWQTYNNDTSANFRSTDYEPEIFLQFNTPHPLGPITNRFNRLGYVHQSNGQSQPFSRSWNRIFAEFVFDVGPGAIAIKPWYRLKGPADKDSNPDLWNYLGYGDIRGALKLKSHELSMMFRNNLRIPENKGAIELGWTFPLIRTRMKGYIQYFNGYGESLLDYNYAVNRISAGVSFTDWL